MPVLEQYILIKEGKSNKKSHSPTLIYLQLDIKAAINGALRFYELILSNHTPTTQIVKPITYSIEPLYTKGKIFSLEEVEIFQACKEHHEFLSNEEKWKEWKEQLQVGLLNKLEQLRKYWEEHSKFSYLSSESLIEATAVMSWLAFHIKKAKAELTPKARTQLGEQLNTHITYLDELEKKIISEQALLKRAMFARLEVAYEKADITSDDVSYALSSKLAELGIVQNDDFKERKIRHSLNEKNAIKFIRHIQESDDEELKAKLKTLGWFKEPLSLEIHTGNDKNFFAPRQLEAHIPYSLKRPAWLFKGHNQRFEFLQGKSAFFMEVSRIANLDTTTEIIGNPLQDPTWIKLLNLQKSIREQIKEAHSKIEKGWKARFRGKSNAFLKQWIKELEQYECTIQQKEFELLKNTYENSFMKDGPSVEQQLSLEKMYDELNSNAVVMKLERNDLIKENLNHIKKDITLLSDEQHNLDKNPENALKQIEEWKKSLEYKIERLEREHNNLKESIRNPNYSANSSNTQAVNLRLNRIDNELKYFRAKRVKAEERAKIIENFKKQPNQWEFYRYLLIRLGEVFIAIKACASGLSPLQHDGENAAKATYADIIAKLVSFFPIIGGIGESAVNLIADGLRKLDSVQQEAIVRSISRLGTFRELEKAIADFACKLTEMYANNLQALLGKAEIEQKNGELPSDSIFATVIKRARKSFKDVKEKVLKEESLSQAEILADLALNNIVGALFDQIVTTDKELVPQLTRIATQPPQQNGFQQQVQSLFEVKLITTYNPHLSLDDFYKMPAIKVDNNYYGREDVDYNLYGYRLGTMEEVSELHLIKLSGNQFNPQETYSTEEQCCKESIDELKALIEKILHDTSSQATSISDDNNQQVASSNSYNNIQGYMNVRKNSVGKNEIGQEESANKDIIKFIGEVVNEMQLLATENNQNAQEADIIEQFNQLTLKKNQKQFLGAIYTKLYQYLDQYNGNNFAFNGFLLSLFKMLNVNQTLVNVSIEEIEDLQSAYCNKRLACLLKEHATGVNPSTDQPGQEKPVIEELFLNESYKNPQIAAKVSQELAKALIKIAEENSGSLSVAYSKLYETYLIEADKERLLEAIDLIRFKQLESLLESPVPDKLQQINQFINVINSFITFPKTTLYQNKVKDLLVNKLNQPWQYSVSQLIEAIKPNDELVFKYRQLWLKDLLDLKPEALKVDLINKYDFESFISFFCEQHDEVALEALKYLIESFLVRQHNDSLILNKAFKLVDHLLSSIPTSDHLFSSLRLKFDALLNIKEKSIEKELSKLDPSDARSFIDIIKYSLKNTASYSMKLKDYFYTLFYGKLLYLTKELVAKNYTAVSVEDFYKIVLQDPCLIDFDEDKINEAKNLCVSFKEISNVHAFFNLWLGNKNSVYLQKIIMDPSFIECMFANFNAPKIRSILFHLNRLTEQNVGVTQEDVLHNLQNYTKTNLKNIIEKTNKFSEYLARKLDYYLCNFKCKNIDSNDFYWLVDLSYTMINDESERFTLADKNKLYDVVHKLFDSYLKVLRLALDILKKKNISNIPSTLEVLINNYSSTIYNGHILMYSYKIRNYGLINEFIYKQLNNEMLLIWDKITRQDAAASNVFQKISRQLSNLLGNSYTYFKLPGESPGPNLFQITNAKKEIIQNHFLAMQEEVFLFLLKKGFSGSQISALINIKNGLSTEIASGQRQDDTIEQLTKSDSAVFFSFWNSEKIPLKDAVINISAELQAASDSINAMKTKYLSFVDDSMEISDKPKVTPHQILETVSAKIKAIAEHSDSEIQTIVNKKRGFVL